jgi:hypothetical protein
VSQAAALGALEDDEHVRKTCDHVVSEREHLTRESRRAAAAVPVDRQLPSRRDLSVRSGPSSSSSRDAA